MTGLRNFVLTDKEKKKLKDYLDAGGVLFAESAMGSDQFDTSFHALIAELLPAGKLEMLKPNHPLFSNVFKVNQVEYSDVVKAAEPNLHQPMIEALFKDGAPVVIYSRTSLSNGWEQLQNPYAKAYADEDALKLGTNILVYALTH
ncbi:MAG: DUF4159 domain-containing protein, partial [Phycisphaerae bacterium]